MCTSAMAIAGKPVASTLALQQMRVSGRLINQSINQFSDQFVKQTYLDGVKEALPQGGGVCSSFEQG